MELEKFERLGKKVDGLLARVEELGRVKEEFSKRLAAKEQEIKQLNEKIMVYEQERSLVRSKVDELLERIDQRVKD